MAFRTFGLSVAMTAFALLASLSAASPVSAHSRHDYHGHRGHQGGGHKQKVCYDVYPNVRCFYR
jgi:hypothetical protein